jgi:hypothetical protein
MRLTRSERTIAVAILGAEIARLYAEREACFDPTVRGGRQKAARLLARINTVIRIAEKIEAANII